MIPIGVSCHRSYLFPGWLLFITVILSCLPILSCTRNLPKIEKISPNRVKNGDVVTVTGRNFGFVEDADIYLDNVRLLRTAITTWTNDRIQFTMPASFTSGFLFLKRDSRESNRIYLIKEDDTAGISLSPLGISKPTIQKISPDRADPGDYITIIGGKFDRNRYGGKVYFSIDSNNDLFFIDSDSLDKYVEAESYDSWSDENITAMVPRDAVSGSIFVKTPQGFSNSAYLEIKEKSGEIIYGGDVNRLLRISCVIDEVDSSPGNALFIEPSFTDGNSMHLSDDSLNSILPEGGNVFEFYELKNDVMRDFSFTVATSSQEISCIINDSNRIYTSSGDFHKKYTAMINEDPEISGIYGQIARRSLYFSNKPYLLARFVYDFFASSSTETGIGEAVNNLILQIREEPLTLPVHLTAVLRTLGIPARPIYGFFIEEEKVRLHGWIEVYLPGFGWFPADPILAMEENERRDFWWGHISSDHISLTKNRFPTDGNSDTDTIINHLYGFDINGAKNLSRYRLTWSVALTSGLDDSQTEKGKR